MKRVLLISFFSLKILCLRGQELDSGACAPMSSTRGFQELLTIDTLPYKGPTVNFFSSTSSAKYDSLVDTSRKLQIDDGVLYFRYDSDYPGDAPWTQRRVTTDDLKNFGKGPSLTGKALSVSDVKKRRPNIADVKLSADSASLKNEIERVSASYGDLKRNAQIFDGLNTLKSELEESSLQEELRIAKRIYSDKYLQKLYDSLGVRRADSIFSVAKKYAKSEVSKEIMLELLNTAFDRLPERNGLSFDNRTGALKSDDVDKLISLPDEADRFKKNSPAIFDGKNISHLKLPTGELIALAPLRGMQTDADKLPVIDSLRAIAMAANNIKLDERRLTDELKRTAFKKELAFFDKSYFEGILGVINDSTFRIVQMSPTWGYHFAKDISFGLGPVLSVEYHEKRINAVVGFRSFIKGEFWQQRVYVQVEDDARPITSKYENSTGLRHSLLAGVGGLLPISKRIAFNVGVFYRVNQEQVQPGGSPWAFRIGLSSIQNIRP